MALNGLNLVNNTMTQCTCQPLQKINEQEEVDEMKQQLRVSMF